MITLFNLFHNHPNSKHQHNYLINKSKKRKEKKNKQTNERTNNKYNNAEAIHHIKINNNQAHNLIFRQDTPANAPTTLPAITPAESLMLPLLLRLGTIMVEVLKSGNQSAEQFPPVHTNAVLNIL
jgi:hypothetical protein